MPRFPTPPVGIFGLHLASPPSAPTLSKTPSQHPFASTAPHASPGSADTRWPAATAADPEKKSWLSTADPRLVELSEEQRCTESSASRIENGTRNRFLGAPKLS